MHLRSSGKFVSRQLGQIALTIAFLPYDAYISLDAIVRTLTRQLITRKQLLEWQTASEVEQNAHTDLAGFYRTMWVSPVLAAVALVFLLVEQPGQLAPAAPFLLLWLGAPAIAWWISQPIIKTQPELTDRQRNFLRRNARRTWRFFEVFVTAKDNWLPPDNFQEHPEPVIATRTSPTNLGLSLLANLAACDFGYLPVGQLIERTRNAFATMEGLERHRGHFYNWYDTRSLKPLLPFYISTVDSGNLAGHLFTLGAGLTEFSESGILKPQCFEGLRDSLGIVRELVRDHPLLKPIETPLENPPTDLHGAWLLLERLVQKAAELTAALADQSAEVKRWSAVFEQDCRRHLEDLRYLVPWLPLLAEIKQKDGHAASSVALESEVPEKSLRAGLARLERIQTLRELASLDSSLEMSLTEILAPLPSANNQNWPEQWLRDLLQAVHESSQRARASRRWNRWPVRRRVWPIWTSGSSLIRSAGFLPSVTT
jgi:cyclic beta-1,2-glucan synthetase